MLTILLTFCVSTLIKFFFQSDTFKMSLLHLKWSSLWQQLTVEIARHNDFHLGCGSVPGSAFAVIVTIK